MTGFFSKIFGKKEVVDGTPQGTISSILEGLFDAANLDLKFDIEMDGNTVNIELSGADEDMLREKEGQLIDAIQLFLTRVSQHQLRGDDLVIRVDNAGFREQVNSELIELAEKLKGMAMEKGKPVYIRALSPRDRKVVHQYLAEDTRVKSRSVGEGIFKKIKIFPIRDEQQSDSTTETM
jgi:spoIIIJ-associated protein